MGQPMRVHSITCTQCGRTMQRPWGLVMARLYGGRWRCLARWCWQCILELDQVGNEEGEDARS